MGNGLETPFLTQSEADLSRHLTSSSSDLGSSIPMVETGSDTERAHTVDLMDQLRARHGEIVAKQSEADFFLRSSEENTEHA